MRTIEIDKELLLVEVPKDASDFKDTGACGIYFKSKNGYYDSIYFDDIFYPSDNYEIIGLIETPNLDFDFEVNESWVESIVYDSDFFLNKKGNLFKDYTIIEKSNEFCFLKAKDSFHTRIQKTIQDNGLYLDNPKSHPLEYECTNRRHYEDIVEKWQEAEEKTIKGNLLLIKKV